MTSPLNFHRPSFGGVKPIIPPLPPDLRGIGEDKIVLPPSDKNVRPLKKKKKEEDKLVNEEHALSGIGELTIKTPTVEAKAKREYLAHEMLSVLKDDHSLGYYRKVAGSLPQHKIFEALSTVKQMSREGAIRANKGALFLTMIKRHSTRSRT